MSETLTIDDLETVWECLAEAIDRAGSDRQQLFLAKLAILLAYALGDRGQVEALMATALEDLE